MAILPQPTAETYAAILSASETDEESLDKAVKELKLWLQEQPHLPHEFDEKMLRLYYLRSKKNMKKAKASVEEYYTSKNKYSEILRNRDPCQPWFKDASETVFGFPLVDLNDDVSRVLVAGNLHSDISTYHVHDVLKLSSMIQELRALEEFTPFDVYIIDCKNAHLSHMMKYTLPLVWKVYTVTMKGYRCRLNSLHFINAPTYIDILLKIVKLVAKPKLFKRMYVHKGLGNLHEFVPLRILPNEYGGEAGSLHDIWREWKQKLLDNRDWFIRQDELKIEESKKPK